MEYCDNCTLFNAYEKGEKKEPNNCTTWLYNCGKCPLGKTTIQKDTVLENVTAKLEKK